MERMEAEARKSRRVLTTLLAQLRKPLAGSGLWPTTWAAATLCASSFEKAYLTKLSGRIYGAPPEPTELSGLAAELFMFAALTVDDWSDGTTFRAGKPAIHSTYGPKTTVLAANCLIETAHLALNAAVIAAKKTLRSAFLESFRSAAFSIQAGQADILALNGKPIGSVAVMERLARLRCGKLIGSAMSSGAYLSGCTESLPALVEAGEWLGIALQHRNDIQDFTVSFDQNIKPPLADLLNGQPNLVVCFLLQALPRMTRNERSLFTSMHARNCSQPRKTLTQSEFSAVLDLVTRYRVADAAACQMAACVARSREAAADFFPSSTKREFGDYLELVLRP